MKKVAILLLTCLCLTSCLALRPRDELPDLSDTSSETTPVSDATEPSAIQSYDSEAADKRPDPAETDAPVPSEPALTSPFDGVSIDFAAVGDNLIHANIWMGAEARGTAEKKYDFLPMYEQIAPFIKDADVAFINQETIMAGDAKYGLTAYPTFNSPQQLAYDLAELGFDVLNLATNHMLDKGESGYRDYLDFINTLPFTTVGGYYNEADRSNIRITEVQGVKIAWLSYTEHTNWIFLPAGSEMSVPYAGTYLADYTYDIDEDRIRADIAAAEAMADVTIVSLHCGTEYTHVPNDTQRKITQIMADSGVEVILGHHSHCLQPIEWITGANGNQTLCIFSLGNIASGQNTPLKLVGGVFTFRIIGDGQGGLKVVDPYLEPTVMYYDVNWLNEKIYLLENYTDEIAATQGMLSHTGASLTPVEAAAIVTGCIDEEYLPEWLHAAN